MGDWSAGSPIHEYFFLENKRLYHILGEYGENRLFEKYQTSAAEGDHRYNVEFNTPEYYSERKTGRAPSIRIKQVI